MEDLEFGDKISSALGFESTSSSAIDEAVNDEERLGTQNSIFSNFGVTFVIGSAILAFIVLVVVLIIIGGRKCHCSQKNQARVKSIKQKIFFNPIIRYLLLNALKLNFVSLVVFKSTKERTLKEISVSVVTFAVVNISPIIFLYVLRKNRDHLNEEDKVKSFGSLYLGKNIQRPTHKVHRYPLAFFWRRIAFISATVFLLDYPLLQIVTNHVLTLATLIYLVNDT